MIEFIESQMPKCFKYFSGKDGVVEIISMYAGKGTAAQFLANFIKFQVELLVLLLI